MPRHNSQGDKAVFNGGGKVTCLVLGRRTYYYYSPLDSEFEDFEDNYLKWNEWVCIQIQIAQNSTMIYPL